MFNLFLWGASGTGKTYSYLRLAKERGLRLKVFDTHLSTRPYADKYEFDVTHTDDPNVIKRELDQLLESCPYDLIVIDDISGVWHKTQLLCDDSDRDRRKVKDQFHTALTQASWGPIKRVYNSVIHTVRQFQTVPVIVTCRETDFYVGESVGGQKPDTEKNTQYEFDTNLRLQVIDGGKKHVTKVLKVRGQEPDGPYIPGTLLKAPLWEEIPRMFPSAFEARTSDPAPPEEKTEDNGRARKQEPFPTPEQVAEFMTLTQGFDMDAVRERLNTKHGNPEFGDLPRSKAEEILVTMRGPA